MLELLADFADLRIFLQQEAILVVLQKMTKLFFVVAKLLFAIRTGKTSVRFFGESLGMAKGEYFPYGKKQQRDTEQTPSIQTRDPHERRKHHRKIPIIDATASAAFIFHKPSLKRTEKQNADHIADGIGKTDQQQNSLVDHARAVQKSDHQIERDPSRRHGENASIGSLGRNGSLRWNKILFELLLTAHALRVRRKKAQKHFRDEDDPYRAENDGIVTDLAEGRFRVTDTVHDIEARRRDQQDRAENQFEVVQR